MMGTSHDNGKRSWNSVMDFFLAYLLMRRVCNTRAALDSRKQSVMVNKRSFFLTQFHSFLSSNKDTNAPISPFTHNTQTPAG